jgi:formylglycine-generating enzyme required for sulfatase activity
MSTAALHSLLGPALLLIGSTALTGCSGPPPIREPGAPPPAPAPPPGEAALPAEAVPLEEEAWIPSRFKAESEPLIAPDPSRAWASGDISCPDLFELPEGGLAMLFQYDDPDGSSGIGRAVKGEQGWVLDPEPALVASALGLERLACTSTALVEGRHRTWVAAARPGQRQGILELQWGPGASLDLAEGADPLLAPDGQSDLRAPSVLLDQGMFLLYVHMSGPEGDSIALFDAPEAQDWKLVTPSVMHGSTHAEVEIPMTPLVTMRDDTYLLWVAVERHRHAPSDKERAEARQQAVTERALDDIRYAVLFSASEDPSVFDFELNPIVVKPGRKSWKNAAVDSPAVATQGDEVTMVFRGIDAQGRSSIGMGRSQFRPKSSEAIDPLEEQQRLAPLTLPPDHRIPPSSRSTGPDGEELLRVGEVSYTLRPIPAGRFGMGSPPDEAGRDPDETQHEVVLSSPFFLGSTEVTQALFEAVTGLTPSEFEGPQRPVEQVSWDDAVIFCNLLSEALGLQPAYAGEGNNVVWIRQADGYRLPSEAEWEYAARAGAVARRFAVEGPLVDSAWHSENSGGQTHDVGQLLPNPWGLFDLNGNVYEWVWDRKGHYRLDDVDPVGPESKNLFRVERGGSFRNGERNTRLANRGRFEHYQRSFNLGFRLARGATTAQEEQP